MEPILVLPAFALNSGRLLAVLIFHVLLTGRKQKGFAKRGIGGKIGDARKRSCSWPPNQSESSLQSNLATASFLTSAPMSSAALDNFSSWNQLLSEFLPFCWSSEADWLPASKLSNGFGEPASFSILTTASMAP